MRNRVSNVPTTNSYTLEVLTLARPEAESVPEEPGKVAGLANKGTAPHFLKLVLLLKRETELPSGKSIGARLRACGRAQGRSTA